MQRLAAGAKDMCLKGMVCSETNKGSARSRLPDNAREVAICLGLVD